MIPSMKTIFATFMCSFSLALLLTPWVGRIAKRYNLVDVPTGRKVHINPIPRIGGVALYIAAMVPLCCLFFFPDLLCDEALLQCLPSISPKSLVWLFTGGTVIFLVGFMDDLFRLRPSVKFAWQAVAGSLAYMGGIGFSQIQLPWNVTWTLGWLSLPVTVFWFLLVINAINLIDGLDGLAAGISLFSSLMLLALCLLGERYHVAVALAALAGACIGFLRYNFNPASIFMGDGGSYFLGYMLGALSILGSMKSQATVTILIPIIALGLPLIDTILAPLRRFIIGKQMFQPDKSHIHHKLLRMGISHRNTVLILYGATIILGLFALLLINIHDQRSAVVLFILGVCVFFGIRKLGYFEYFAIDKVVGYFQDVTDTMGLQKDRRTFLNLQIAINNSTDTDELWHGILDALELLKIDQAEMVLQSVCFIDAPDTPYRWLRQDKPVVDEPEKCRHRVLSIALPLVDDRKSFGTLSLQKDLIADPISHYTLRRIEHLRRSIVRKLIVLDSENRKS